MDIMAVIDYIRDRAAHYHKKTTLGIQGGLHIRFEAQRDAYINMLHVVTNQPVEDILMRLEKYGEC